MNKDRLLLIITGFIKLSATYIGKQAYEFSKKVISMSYITIYIHIIYDNHVRNQMTREE